MQYAYADAYTTSREKMISGAFASTMHLLFIALLVFGVNWQKKVEPQVNIVDLWSPPSAAPPQAAPPPPPPEPPKPEVQPKVDPAPPQPVAKPEVAKPDIAFKDKQKVEKTAPRVVEDKQKEAKKREDDTQAAQKAQQAEAQRLANEQAEAQKAVAAQAASAQSKMRSEYMERIRAKILRALIKPPNIQGSEEAEFNIVVLPDGNVLNARVKRASGNSAYDNAIERAITRAQPLPMPPDPALLKEFRELNLKFNAKE
ncbi:MAG: cell envelope integrity protein TolA [Betaproteobacteria bacterium]|nr:cell envelope integrity protein TolA [Betaproteobacteria bacterium]